MCPSVVPPESCASEIQEMTPEPADDDSTGSERPAFANTIDANRRQVEAVAAGDDERLARMARALLALTDGKTPDDDDLAALGVGPEATPEDRGEWESTLLGPARSGPAKRRPAERERRLRAAARRVVAHGRQRGRTDATTETRGGGR
jgi:hypothetical protein